MSRRGRWLLTGLVAAAVGAADASPSRAQDVLVHGRDAGVEAPAWVRAALASDPGAFQFERAWIQKVERILATRRAVAPSLGPSYLASDLASASASVTGTLAVPVILALYEDVTAPYTPTDYDERLFGDGQGIVSVSEYYDEVSGGLFAMDGTIPPWVDMPTTAENYEGLDTSDRFGEIWHFLRNALEGADPGLDFGLFDNDGPDGVPNSGDDDGYVDVTAFLYATVAMSCGGDATGIWPHRWTYRSARYSYGDGVFSPFTTDDPAAGGGFILVNDYIVQSGLDCDGSTIMGSGTMSHELGHALALPDLYDTNGGSEGIGHWGLMGSGNWNCQTSPAHMSAWSKEMMGWVDVTTLTSPGTVVLDPVLSSREVLRMDLPDTPEYFLLSNRQPLGSDEYLHGPGLLIWHIDPTRTNNTDETRKWVDLEEADGRDDLDNGANRGDSGDPYPQFGNEEFTGGSYPRALAYEGGLCTPGVRNISAGPGSSITFDFEPEELWILWGDINRSGVLAPADVAETYFYSIGWRDAETQAFMAQGDVDGDGDVDVRDGFLIHSRLDGLPTDGFRVGELESSECMALPPLPVAGAGAGSRIRGGGG